MIKKLFSVIKSMLFGLFVKKKKYKMSYSQCGEDIIIDFLCYYLGIKSPTYLDIGANDPIILSNTYFFYKCGCSGVLIEPDKELYNSLKKARKNDIVINAGIGLDNNPFADFYILSAKTLNTFSKIEAERLEQLGKYKIEEVVKVPLININDIISKNYTNSPDIISIDIEGLDFDVIKSLDFGKYRPKIICVETLEYSEKKDAKKNNELINYLEQNGYKVYADTFINTIFYDGLLIRE